MILIKELTELNGVSGNENEVREYIKSKINGLCDSIEVDTIGNIIAYKKGSSGRLKVMLSAHMDEVGFMVSGYMEKGFLKFKTVGGIDSRILPGKRVVIGKKRLKGVIGAKPLHQQSPEERERIAKIKDLYIDIGAETKEEAEKLAPLGEFVAFDSDYVELGNDCIKAKALDDRVGCAVLMEVLKYKFEFDLYACFTVQEEVGLRGAQVAAFKIMPDVALVLEGTTCADVPEVKPFDFSTELGNGAALTLVDRTCYSDRKLVQFLYDTAVKNGIKVQFKQTTTGGNDAGQIQRTGNGVKTASISVPCRYIHSPVSVMSRSDFECVERLTLAALNEMNKDKDFTKNVAAV
ncbi:M42 family metallopeptidase [Ruminiclostridium papyrosolvens]|uniref:Aminopeptidase n=1 Tax=Ruminiclostridium papyrosolvens C7 TaxID=1330534 RepID=U4R488_9FIRM|nr:M42 family metallopeptidase [Ruminiclostridium papyrosolvens]EPR13324.1 aminopeptidase [Ruminiclostridium papyrosolvens C7]